MTRAADAADGKLAPGAVVGGRYRVLSLMGKGGMGAVYEAEHLKLGSRVALKVVLPELVGDPSIVARFMREARAAASIGHAGIVQVFDLDQDGQSIYQAMERLDGEELFDRIKRDHPLPPSLVLRVGIEMADALAAAHETGIVHRDLKPQNIFLARQGRTQDVVKILDFGIAKLTQRADAPITRTGQVMGTPLYMAPEQLRTSQDIDGRVDVYAMGAILYEALVGKPPYQAETYPELVLKISMESPPPIAHARHDVPVRLIEIIEKAMAKDRDARWPSAAALRDALEEMLASPQLWSTPVSLSPGAPEPPPRIQTLSSTAPADTPLATESTPPTAIPGARARWPWLVGAAAALAGTVATVFVLLGGESNEPSGEVEVAAPAPPPAPQEAEPRAEPAPTEPVEPVGGERQRVRFASAPRDGAEVSIDGRVVCTTPCEAELEVRRHTLTISRRGFRTVTHRLEPPFPEEVGLELERRLPGRPGQTSGSPGTSLPPLMER
jgi:serine/threonine-protein kinase